MQNCTCFRLGFISISSYSVFSWGRCSIPRLVNQKWRLHSADSRGVSVDAIDSTNSELFTTSSQNAIRNRKTNKLSTVIVCIKYWNAYVILHNYIISRAWNIVYQWKKAMHKFATYSSTLHKVQKWHNCYNYMYRYKIRREGAGLYINLQNKVDGKRIAIYMSFLNNESLSKL